MKNRIIGVLLAALMLVSILPFAALTAFADKVGFTVTRSGGPAVAEEDYEWFNGILYIYEDGLTVSGKIDDGRIFCMASDLTFENFSINNTGFGHMITVQENCVLYLKGDNTLVNECDAKAIIHAHTDLEIAGDGNLNAISEYDGIDTMGSLTVSASGKIDIDAVNIALHSMNVLIIKEAANMLFARGKNENYGAVECEGFNISGYHTVKGSTDIVNSIDSVTVDAWYNSTTLNFCAGGFYSVAKTVLILGDDRVVVSLGAKVNEKTSSLRLGARYNGFFLGSAERASVEDLGMLFYPSHLLGETALDLANVSAARMSATAIEEFDSAKKFVDYNSFTFYVTIVNIPDKGKDTDISFRPYIIYDAGTVYGDVYERSYYSVLDAAGVLAYKQGDNEISCPDNWFD